MHLLYLHSWLGLGLGLGLVSPDPDPNPNQACTSSTYTRAAGATTSRKTRPVARVSEVTLTEANIES